MEIVIYIAIYTIACFIAGVLVVTFCSTEKLSSLSVFEITKYGFYSLSFIVLIIVTIIIALIT